MEREHVRAKKDMIGNALTAFLAIFKRLRHQTTGSDTVRHWAGITGTYRLRPAVTATTATIASTTLKYHFYINIYNISVLFFIKH